MKISDLLLSTFVININDPLIKAINLLGEKGRYRLVIIDDENKVQGVISGRRILEVLLKRRGTSIIEEKGLDFVLNESINLFMDEVYQLFFEDTDLETILKYMSENMIGYVILIDYLNKFKGMIEEISFLLKFKGKKLGINIEEIMSKKVHTIDAESTLYDASKTMINERLRRLPVLEKEKLIGIITISDILRELVKTKKIGIEIDNIFKYKVKDIMNKNIISIEPWADVGDALEKILEKDVSGILVIHEDKLLGMVSRIDILSKITKIKGISKILEMIY